MVWGDGERRYLPDNEAAAIAGLNVISIRNALTKPHVLAYYREQREVLRARESPANIHRLCEIRDAADNMPAVNAIRALEQIGDEQQTNRPNTPTPGISIRIVQVSSPPAPIDIKSAPRIIDAGDSNSDNREASDVVAHCSALSLGSIWEDRRSKSGLLASRRLLKTQRYFADHLFSKQRF
jgi:hypothetical protein